MNAIQMNILLMIASNTFFLIAFSMVLGIASAEYENYRGGKRK